MDNVCSVITNALEYALEILDDTSAIQLSRSCKYLHERYDEYIERDIKQFFELIGNRRTAFDVQLWYPKCTLIKAHLSYAFYFHVDPRIVKEIAERGLYKHLKYMLKCVAKDSYHPNAKAILTDHIWRYTDTAQCNYMQMFDLVKDMPDCSDVFMKVIERGNEEAIDVIDRYYNECVDYGAVRMSGSERVCEMIGVNADQAMMQAFMKYGTRYIFDNLTMDIPTLIQVASYITNCDYNHWRIDEDMRYMARTCIELIVGYSDKEIRTAKEYLVDCDYSCHTSLPTDGSFFTCLIIAGSGRIKSARSGDRAFIVEHFERIHAIDSITALDSDTYYYKDAIRVLTEQLHDLSSFTFILHALIAAGYDIVNYMNNEAKGAKNTLSVSSMDILVYVMTIFEASFISCDDGLTASMRYM